MSSGRTVHGVGTPRSMRVHWTLHELGLPYETLPVQSRSGETGTEAFLKLNPRGKIPVLTEGDFILAESGAIAAYLADAHAPGALIPATGTRERAIHDQWVFFTLMELDATSLYVVRRHGGLPDIYGASPVVVDSCLAYFRRQLEVAEAELGDGRPHLCGDTFAVADIHLTSCLDWAGFLGEPLPEKLAAYRARHVARPAYTAAFAVNYPPEVLQALARPN